MSQSRSKFLSISIESKAMVAALKRVESQALDGIKGAVKYGTSIMFDEVHNSLQRRGGTGRRSRPGEPARTDTGRFLRGTFTKSSPKGWVGYVTTNNVATDKKGRRYPWMLESGTRTVKKRPTFKKAMKKTKPKYVERLLNAWRAALR